MAKVFNTILIPIVGIKKNESGDILIKESIKGSFYYQLESNAPKSVRSAEGKVPNRDAVVCQFFDTEKEAEEEALLDLKFIKELKKGQVWNVEVTRVTEDSDDDGDI